MKVNRYSLTPVATPWLNEDQQAKARRHIRGFFWLNGIAVTCVMENILLLWALRNGLSAPRVAVLSSFIFMAMPFMLLGRRVSARLGLVRAKGLCWALRYVCVLLMVPAPWLQGTFLAPAVPWLVMACTFALFAFRSMGMINTVPLMGAAAGPGNLGSFQAGTSMRSHLSYFVSMILVMLLLRVRDGVGVYQAILSAGSVVGMLSVVVLMGAPEPAGLREGARLRFGEVLRDAMRKTTSRRLAVAWSASMASVALIVPIGMLAVKQGYGVTDDAALGFTLVELAGAILASAALTVIADHAGPRPIIILSMSLFLGTAGFWALAPERFFPLAVGGAFLLAGISRGGLHLALSHYLLATSTVRERLGVGMLMQVLSGAVSGLGGMLIAGGLLRALSPSLGEGLALYHLYYRIVFALVLVLLVAAIRLPRLKEWTVHNVIGLVFSFNDLRTLMVLNRLQKNTDDEAEIEGLDRLGSLGSRHSEPLLREFLVSGRLAPRSRAIDALGRIHFGEETVRALIREVREGAFTNGWRAAELLGQRRVAESVPALRAGLNSEDMFLRGKCMVALARLGDPESTTEIRRQFCGAENARILIHGAQALAILRDPADLPMLLKAGAEGAWPDPVRDEVLLAAASLCGQRRRVYRALRALTRDPATAPGAPPPADAGPATPAVEAVRAFVATQHWSDLPVRIRCALAAMLGE